MIPLLDAPYEGPKFFGKVKGYCRDNADPENRGRLRCYCPQVMGVNDDSAHWTGWALPCFPWLGGMTTIDSGPPLTKQQNNGVDVGIWLEFEDGHPDHPIWVGTFLPVPTPTSPTARQNPATAGGNVGGDLITNPSPGSNLAALNPPQPIVPSNEIRLLAKEGQEIVIGVTNGGYITLGPYGVTISGVQVLLNGKGVLASRAEKVFG